MKKKILDKKAESLCQSCEVLLKKNGVEMPKNLQKKPEMDEETANLLMALESFWTAWRETFGEGHKRKCYEDYLEIRARLQKPEVTEEWIEEKAEELSRISFLPYSKSKAKNFIRSLVEEKK